MGEIIQMPEPKHRREQRQIQEALEYAATHPPKKGRPREPKTLEELQQEALDYYERLGHRVVLSRAAGLEDHGLFDPFVPPDQPEDTFR